MRPSATTNSTTTIRRRLHRRYSRTDKLGRPSTMHNNQNSTCRLMNHNLQGKEFRERKNFIAAGWGYYFYDH
ncbi:hypothetical protein vseg_003440 [Gypsophila vaccaria]